MNPFKKWIYTFFVTIFFIFGITAGLNYIADPFGGSTKWVERKYKPIIDDEKQKYNYIFARENYSKFDTVILGSSRTMCIRPGTIPALRNAYNFGTTSATLGEELFILEKWLNQPDSQLKTVVLGIDFLMFDQKANLMSPRQIEDKFTRSNNYTSYLLSFDTLLLSIRCIQNQWLQTPIVYFRDDGSINYSQRDLQIQNDRFDFSDNRMLRDATERCIPHQQTVYDRQALQHLIAIKELCQQKGVTLIPFITPEHRILFSMLMENPDLRENLLMMRSDLLTVFDTYYDFGGFNEINSKNENFYDNLHYRPDIGTLIATQLLSPATAVKNAHYGNLVTRQNIQSHLQQAAFYPLQNNLLGQAMK